MIVSGSEKHMQRKCSWIAENGFDLIGMGGSEFKVGQVSTSIIFLWPSSAICMQMLSRCLVVLSFGWSFTREMGRRQWC